MDGVNVAKDRLGNLSNMLAKMAKDGGSHSVVPSVIQDFRYDASEA
jgi:diacylglycerol kinase